jgi:hypothetical protein
MMTRHPSIWAAAAAAAGAFLIAGQAAADESYGSGSAQEKPMGQQPGHPGDTAHEAAGTAQEPAGTAQEPVEKSTDTVVTETTTTTMQPASAATPTSPGQPPGYSEDARRDLLMPPEPSGKGGEKHLVTGFGMALSIGGGVTDFTAERARGATNLGGTYGARLTIGTRLPFAVEVAYIGTAQGMDVLGLDSDAILLGNGGEATLRLNILQGTVSPYIFGGAGLTHYSVENSDFNTSAVEDSDNVYTIPMGAGAALQYRGLVVDGRGTFRYAFEEDLLGEDAKLHNWGAQVNVGFEF